MNWKLITKLSIFGVAIGFGLVFGIFRWVNDSEGILWFLIFFLCTWLIVKYCTRLYFLHAFLTSLLMDIWITFILLAFFPMFLENNPNLAAKARLYGNPLEYKLTFLIGGQIWVIGFGLILGLFSQGVAYLIKKRRSRAARSSL